MQVEIASYCKCFTSWSILIESFSMDIVKVTNFIEIPLAISADALILSLHRDDAGKWMYVWGRSSKHKNKSFGED